MALMADELQVTKADRDSVIKNAKRRAAQKAATLRNKEKRSPENDIKSVCTTLLRIAQRYVPAGPTAYPDFSELVRCVKILKALGLNPEIAERFSAPVSAAGNEVVINSFDYRHLRNKSIAGFATIADLTEKPAAVGSPEFQKGVREGYRRASDIATLFLEDIQGGAS